MSKQTPVQFLRKKYFETGMLYETDFEKAEQMHREQIELSNFFGFNDGCNSAKGRPLSFQSPEQYYKQTYKG